MVAGATGFGARLIADGDDILDGVDRPLKIDVDVGCRALGFAQQPAFPVAQAGAAMRGAAVDAEEKALCAHKRDAEGRGSARLCRFGLTGADPSPIRETG